MNQQPIEKRRVQDTGDFLEVHSIFHTIQGEGPFCGTPAVFIRLAGCNLQCPGCDTDYTSNRELLSVETIMRIVRREGKLGSRTRLVVITGGEPFRQDLSVLCKALLSHNFFVQIESNGTLPTSAGVSFNRDIDARTGVYVVVSPKTGKVVESIQYAACAYKYVISYDSVDMDGLPIRALGHSAHPRLARPPLWFRGLVYLQPMDAHDEAINQLNLKAAVTSCIDNGYILQMQIHKLIGVP
jgi:7-carboxy-7-deazaguanine synthase